MIVVDTNVLAYLLLPSAQTASAEAVWASDRDWVAPPLIHSELRNVVLGSVRRGVLLREHAFTLLDEAGVIVSTPHPVDGREALSMALESGCSAYDCEFAWLARALRLPLVTADRRLGRAFAGSAMSMDDFLSR